MEFKGKPHYFSKKLMMNNIFIPTFSYQGQTWSLTKVQERKTTINEMRLLKRAVNVTRRETEIITSEKW